MVPVKGTLPPSLRVGCRWACDPEASLCWLCSPIPVIGSGWAPDPVHGTWDFRWDFTFTVNPNWEVASLELLPTSWYHVKFQTKAITGRQSGGMERNQALLSAESTHHWSQTQPLDLSDYIKSYFFFLLKASLVWVFFPCNPNSPNWYLSEGTLVTLTSASWLTVFTNLTSPLPLPAHSHFSIFQDLIKFYLLHHTFSF